MSIFGPVYETAHEKVSLQRRLAICIPFAVVFTILQLQQSLAIGRLSSLPQYDDVVYHTNGLYRLSILREGGMLSLLESYWNQMMWTPWGVLASTFGFALFGIDPWSIYAINGLLVLAMLFLVDWATAGASFRVKLACWIFVLCLPIMGHTVTDFRPDFAAAIATAAAILVVLRMSALESARKTAAVAGVFIGLAMLAKPTIFAATLVYIGAAGILMTIREAIAIRKNPDLHWKGLSINIAVTWIVAIFVAGTHYFRFGHVYFNYFWVNTFGGRAKHWDRGLDGFENFDYFLRGPAGIVMFGRELLPILILAVAGTIFALARKHKVLGKYLLQVWVIAAFCLLVPATNTTKNPYFALVFGMLLVMIAVMGLRQMLSGPVVSIKDLCKDWGKVLHKNVRRIAELSLAIVLVVWAVVAFDFPRSTPGAITPTSRPGFDPTATDAMARAVAGALIQARPIAQEAFDQTDQRGVIQTYITASGYINKDTLAYIIIHAGQGRWPIAHGAFLESPEAHADPVSKSHLIIAFEDGILDEQGRPLIHRFPGGSFPEQTLSVIRADPGLQEFARIPSPSGPAAIVFVRTDAPLSDMQGD